MKKISGIILILCMLISILPINVFAASQVNIFNVTVEEPKIGAKPSVIGSVPQTASTYVTNVRWEGPLDSKGCFKAYNTYTVYVTVRIKEGQDKFIKEVAGKTKVNGAIADIISISADMQEAIICYVFPPCINENVKPASDKTLNIPGLSVNESEWEVLRLSNIERAKENLESMSMVNDLQKAADIREVEITKVFSHTRPDGSHCLTVIPEKYTWGQEGENIADGQRSAQQVVDEWMDSPGHRKAIMHKNFGYMAVGFYLPTYSWLQLFASRKETVSYTVSTDQREFASKEDILGHYMTLVASNGVVSYLPLDFDSMVNQNGNYTPRITGTNLPVFTLAADKPKITGSLVTKFTDVTSDAYYASSVIWAVDKGITSGISDTEFAPDMTCTKAQILTFLWRAAGSPVVGGPNNFTDVNESDYFYQAAQWASSKNMISGSKFNGNTPCTRFTTVFYLWKLNGCPTNLYDNRFKDVAFGTNMADVVGWAVTNGITSGISDTEFAPDMTCTRGQIVTFLQRAFK